MNLEIYKTHEEARQAAQERIQPVIDTERVLAHFGYEEPAPDKIEQIRGIGLWPNLLGSLEEYLAKLPDFVTTRDTKRHPFRITIDYDPDFPKILFRFTVSNPSA